MLRLLLLCCCCGCSWLQTDTQNHSPRPNNNNNNNNNSHHHHHRHHPRDHQPPPPPPPTTTTTKNKTRYPSGYAEPLAASALEDLKALATVVATKDVAGEKPGDLPFKKGDKLKVVSKNGGDYWTAVLGDALGDIPRTAVMLPPPPKPAGVSAEGKKAPPPPPPKPAEKKAAVTRQTTSGDSSFDNGGAGSGGGGGGGGGAGKSTVGGGSGGGGALAAAAANFAGLGMAFEKKVWQFQAFRDLFLDSYLCSHIAATAPSASADTGVTLGAPPPKAARPVDKRLSVFALLLPTIRPSM